MPRKQMMRIDHHGTMAHANVREIIHTMLGMGLHPGACIAFLVKGGHLFVEYECGVKLMSMMTERGMKVEQSEVPA